MGPAAGSFGAVHAFHGVLSNARRKGQGPLGRGQVLTFLALFPSRGRAGASLLNPLHVIPYQPLDVISGSFWDALYPGVDRWVASNV